MRTVVGGGARPAPAMSAGRRKVGLVAELHRVRVWAEALIALHLEPGWSFGFDRATKRAGACHYGERRITVSRYLAERWSDDDIHQTLLHEVAHAIAGRRAGHGPAWRRVATELGYVGERTHSGPIASERASWIGRCPAGHEHYRFRKPTRPMSCATCSRRYDPSHAIRWEPRAQPAPAAR